MQCQSNNNNLQPQTNS